MYVQSHQMHYALAMHYKDINQIKSKSKQIKVKLYPLFTDFFTAWKFMDRMTGIVGVVTPLYFTRTNHYLREKEQKCSSR